MPLEFFYAFRSKRETVWSMVFGLIALVGVACGVLLTWCLLIPVVTVVAVAAGVAGAIKGQPLGTVLADTAVLVCVLEASWIATVLAVARTARRRHRTSDSTRRHQPSEHEG